MLKKELEEQIKQRDLTIKKLYAQIEKLSAKINQLTEHIELRNKNDEMISKNINNHIQNNSLKLLQLIEILNAAKERISQDDEKFLELKNFIMQNFPTQYEDTGTKLQNTNSNLSNTIINEKGQIVPSYHIIDISVLIIKNLIKQIKDDFGDNNI
jgi:cell division protein FtsB